MLRQMSRSGPLYHHRARLGGLSCFAVRMTHATKAAMIGIACMTVLASAGACSPGTRTPAGPSDGGGSSGARAGTGGTTGRQGGAGGADPDMDAGMIADASMEPQDDAGGAHDDDAGAGTSPSACADGAAHSYFIDLMDPHELLTGEAPRVPGCAGLAKRGEDAIG